MTQTELFSYISQEYGINRDYPFDKDFESCVFRHKDNKKWFALCMNIPRNKLYGNKMDKIWVLNLKCDPLLRDSVLKISGVYPAYHMNKFHWITLDLENAKEQDIKTLLDVSFELTKKK